MHADEVRTAWLNTARSKLLSTEFGSSLNHDHRETMLSGMASAIIKRRLNMMSADTVKRALTDSGLHIVTELSTNKSRVIKAGSDRDMESSLVICARSESRG